MQSVTLLSLPTESLCSILGWIPRASQKDLRFVNRQFSDILRRTLLASIVFNVHRENLDLSLFEALASNQNGPEPSGLATLVKELTIVSLDPHHSFSKAPSKLDINICEHQLASLLGQALYGLRKILCLRWVAKRNQPPSVSSIITRWISRQLLKLEVLHIPHFQQRPRVFGNLNRPSLLTLRQVVLVLADSPYQSYRRGIQQIQRITANAYGLQQLDVTADSILDINTLFSPVRPRETASPILEATPSLTEFRIEVRGDYGGALSAHTFQHISHNLQFLQVNSLSKYGHGLEVDHVESIWRELQPDHLISLTCLHTNALSQLLINHLTYFSPNLRELGITAVWRYVPRRDDDYYYQVANGFFDTLAPALASRLERLEINVGKNDVLPWCFGRHSSDRFKKMIKKMGRLKSLKVAVLGTEPQGVEQPLVNLLISHVMDHPCLRELDIEPRGFALPKQWPCSDVITVDNDRPLGESGLLRLPDIFSSQDTWYRPELNQDTGLIVYRLSSSGEPEY